MTLGVRISILYSDTYLFGKQAFFRVREHVEVHRKGDQVVDFLPPHGTQVKFEPFEVNDEGGREFSKGATTESVDLRGGERGMTRGGREG